MEFRLSPSQLEAVTYNQGPLLVLAGAGSGKTSVLAARAAHLVHQLSVAPSEILAFTFTRKAAREMLERISSSLGEKMGDMWIGTFHSICLRILRAHASRIGLRPNFVVYDRKDSFSVLDEIISNLGLPSKVYSPQVVGDRISSAKNAIVSHEEYLRIASTQYEKDIAAIYRAYDKALLARNALDFDDILLATVSLFDQVPAVKDDYAQRFKHVLVDEYQDTNCIQFELIRKLSHIHRNVCAVGDDDQSIFGWRGAELGNILSFEEKFPGAKVVRLEENFRSSRKIVLAAKEVIRNNSKRKGKSMWTKNEEGEPVSLFIVNDGDQEAECIAGKVRDEWSRHRSFGQISILYRTNAQSRAIENALFKSRIPYEIVAGLSFYERKEVKDLISYLRIIANPLDDVSLLRVLNVPQRGIGKTTIQKLKEFSKEKNILLFEALRQVRSVDGIGEKAKKAIGSFVGLVDGLAAHGNEGVCGLMKAVVESTGYLEYVSKEGEERLENVEELLRAAEKWDQDSETRDLILFLQELSIMSDVDTWEESSDRVSLMTVHCAKGLEFSVVFIAGVEEGIFPHASSLLEKHELEEERRLFHVALTRAKEKVYLFSAVGRKWTKSDGVISRFAREIPKEVLVVGDLVGYAYRGRF
ncbi:MAG: UvrD-helicase domain-containing protein [Candidatus Eisenbacteria bacterium]|nr:UvrD-helicase domain-containing protein [Candidatus Eisenbacteria bacterium]